MDTSGLEEHTASIFRLKVSKAEKGVNYVGMGGVPWSACHIWLSDNNEEMPANCAYLEPVKAS
jgi:hypothetical protein